MGTKIKGVMVFVMFSGALLSILFAFPNTQPKQNAQTGSGTTLSSAVSTKSANEGMRTRADMVLPSNRYGLQIDWNQTSVSLDELDVHSVPLRAPNQIGVNRSVAVSPNTRAQTFVNSDGSQISVLTIKSSGASGIRVHFRNFALSDGDQVYVYGLAADSIVFGPYANKGPWGSGEFWSGTIVADTAVIEFYSRGRQTGTGFEIFEISHIFPELDSRFRSGEPDILGCELDASCYGDIQKNSVGRILYNDNGSFVCTGTLLNDLAQDYVPYFLTASHCVRTQAVAQTVEVYWFYQTTSCNSGVLRSDIVHQANGANLLVTQSSNDFSLLRLLSDPPGGALFAGWTSAAQPTGTAVFGLHHPGGFVPPDIQSYLRKAGGTITGINQVCADTGLQNGYRTGWTAGTTEPGASGSGLFASDGSLVGVLSCGPAPPTCNNPFTSYSKFSNFYPQIQSYIGMVRAFGAKYDFNGDAKPDYVLYNPGTRQTAIWYLNNNVYQGGAFGPTVSAPWTFVDSADFNGDGHPDYALFNSITRQTAIWYLNNNVFISGAYGPSLPSGWALVAVGDFNANGTPDYVLYNPGTRQTAIWYLNNNVYVSGGYGPTLPAGWNVAGLGDFNRDGHTDYLLFNSTNRQSAVWYLAGRTLLSAAYGPTIASGYQVKGAADFNGDSKPDYALFNATTRRSAIWYMNNNVYVSGAYGPTLPAGWTLIRP
jgi:hypothetical protein